MERKHVVVAVVVVVAGAGVAAAFVTGFGPIPGGGSDENVEGFPTAETDGGTGGGTDDGSAGGTASGGNATESKPPFTFEIVRIEECGRTCRDVTVTLYNNRNETAANVTVYTRIYAGNTTAESNLVWAGKRQVGTMQPNGSHTATQRVTLTYGEAYSVKRHGGWITVLTTVQSSEVTITFERRRDVT